MNESQFVVISSKMTKVKKAILIKRLQVSSPFTLILFIKMKNFEASFP